MCKFISAAIFSMLLICAAWSVSAQATEDTSAAPVLKVKKADSAGHQLCLGIDIMRLAANSYYNDRYGYEFQSDYYLRNEFYLALEGGWGGSTVDYPDLKYKTTNDFLRVGFNKSVLARDHANDWDMMLIGLRFGAANVSRSDITYIVIDNTWGNTPPQTVKGNPFSAFWLELTGGMRVELVKGLFAGWNFRGKFIMNGKSFKDLSPLYIAGYGKGDKAGNFDFNLYISYGIRWNRKNIKVKYVK
jgi:hypothetical protein